MDENIKKKLVVSITVIAVIIAGVVTVKSFSGGNRDLDNFIDNNIPDEDMVQMVCYNSNCQHRGEMPRKEYLKETRRIAVETNSKDIPPLKCPECGQDTYYQYRERR